MKKIELNGWEDEIKDDIVKNLMDLSVGIDRYRAVAIITVDVNGRIFGYSRRIEDFSSFFEVATAVTGYGEALKATSELDDLNDVFRQGEQ